MLSDGLPTSNQITLTLCAIWDPRYIASRNTGKLRALTAKPWRQIQTTPLPKPGSPPPCRKTVNAALHSRRLTFPSTPTENRQSRRPRVEELLLNDASKRRKTSSTPFGVPPNRRRTLASPPRNCISNCGTPAIGMDSTRRPHAECGGTWHDSGEQTERIYIPDTRSSRRFPFVPAGVNHLTRILVSIRGRHSNAWCLGRY